jgi:hypothetical protein
MSDDKSRVVVRMPTLGESVTEGSVRFLKKPGEAVKEGEPVLEVDTDKVTVELSAPEAGVIESLAASDEEVVRVDDPLYVLRTGGAPLASNLPPSLPAVTEATLRWDAGHVQARARGLAEPAAAEAALILTALARALAAAPGLVKRDREVAITWVDVDGESARWVCGALAVDVTVAGALALARTGVAHEPAGWRAQVRVLRALRGPGNPTRGLSRNAGLQLVIGPVRDEAVVVSGIVVVRPMATISAASDTGGRELLRFLAVLHEQLGQV